MYGTVGYIVKYANLNPRRWDGEKTMGMYSTYELAMERVRGLAGGSTRDMVTDWMIPNWWWDSKKSISIETFEMDKDVD
jgi:hypothetical protein